jgi:hypothetical protein
VSQPGSAVQIKQGRLCGHILGSSEVTSPCHPGAGEKSRVLVRSGASGARLYILKNWKGRRLIGASRAFAQHGPLLRNSAHCWHKSLSTIFGLYEQIADACPTESTLEGIQSTETYFGIRYDPGMLSSRVAKTAAFAVASLLKWPSVICLRALTQAGR